MRQVPNIQVGERRLRDSDIHVQGNKAVRGQSWHSNTHLPEQRELMLFATMLCGLLGSHKISKKKFTIELTIYIKNTELNDRLRIYIILTSEQQMDDKGLHENF